MLSQKSMIGIKGFTLVELMIVIAVTGILSAIAVPNYIGYRNKTFCAAAEVDANSIAIALADYFSTSTNATITGGMESLGYPSLSHDNTGTVASVEAGRSITISVTDGSGQCPMEYQAAVGQTASPNGWWSNTTPGIYTKVMGNSTGIKDPGEEEVAEEETGEEETGEEGTGEEEAEKEETEKEKKAREKKEKKEKKKKERKEKKEADKKKKEKKKKEKEKKAKDKKKK
jgi:type IV pilus assembly protein PilA